MKGISPLIASVLLIAITMTLAAILASFVSTYTQSQLGAMPSCVGGTIRFATAAYPDLNASNYIIAVIEVGGVDLNDFDIEVIDTDGNVVRHDASPTTTISAGRSGRIEADFSADNVAAGDDTRVIAGNCPDVKTGWVDLK